MKITTKLGGTALYERLRVDVRLHVLNNGSHFDVVARRPYRCAGPNCRASNSSHNMYPATGVSAATRKAVS